MKSARAARQDLAAEARLCRVLMAMRGVDEHDLARATGYKASTIRNALSDSPGTGPVKLAIEKALDARVFSTRANYRRHHR